jgi:hypothetical protein
MTEMNFFRGTQNSTVEVVSDLYEAGKRDDGHPFIAEVFFVSITFANGERFRHYASFRGCAVHRDEEGESYFEDTREAARAAAQQLVDRVLASDRINELHWDEVDPAYGSDAYVEQGIEAQRAYKDRFDR